MKLTCLAATLCVTCLVLEGSQRRVGVERPIAPSGAWFQICFQNVAKCVPKHWQDLRETSFNIVQHLSISFPSCLWGHPGKTFRWLPSWRSCNCSSDQILTRSDKVYECLKAYEQFGLQLWLACYDRHLPKTVCIQNILSDMFQRATIKTCNSCNLVFLYKILLKKSIAWLSRLVL